jgi:hypothetical protein
LVSYDHKSLESFVQTFEQLIIISDNNIGIMNDFEEDELIGPVHSILSLLPTTNMMYKHVDLGHLNEVVFFQISPL